MDKVYEAISDYRAARARRRRVWWWAIRIAVAVDVGSSLLALIAMSWVMT